MGVPKFCRYICERYPCLLEIINEYQIPDFDNLYLDMNGIIHCCSHPNDTDAHFRITEEDIFKNIFHYIEILFNIIKPQKLFFMAVDGVAPRAKINQQRGRRFRTAREAEAVEARAMARGETISSEARFDSNCITPGTVFMSRLIEQLKYFVTWKISTNKLWQNCKIILSGPDVPGEGEHKIMDYIRYMKAQPGYDPDTRHCLYGLDADLIMLALCTHEPHFTVLREEVKYGKNHKKNSAPEKMRFCLLQISLLREYLEHEFSSIKEKLQFPFDIEKIIDDWILMGFLIGNDFIPNLPNLQIPTGALPLLYQSYMEVLPTLDGYINEAGTLNLERFEKFMERLSQIDTEQFAEHFADLKYFEGKTGRRPNENERTSYKKSNDSPEHSDSPKKSFNKELSALIQSTDDMLIGHSDEEDSLDVDSDTDIYNIEFLQHKRDYYMNKLEYENVDAEVLRSQAEAYVTAIQWNLNYYYNGCCSWSWYYPHHYAPYMSDIRNFKDFKIEFSMGKPFLPFQQLLAVLPAASRSLLPKVYQGLLTEEESPIIAYYPGDFKTDLNQKRNEWEAVVLIPFIDEKNLLDAMEPYNAKLTPEEQKRNKHGAMCVITYTEEDLGLYEAPQYFPSVRNHAKIQLLSREDIEVPMDKLVKGLSKGVKLNVCFAGFPTFRHIKHTAGLREARVKVYDQPSRYESIVISISPSDTPNLYDVASQMLGKTVFVDWPHVREARVIAVSTMDRKINLINANEGYSPENLRIENINSDTSTRWRLQCSSVSDSYMGRFGIDVGDTSVLVHALPMIGRQYILTHQTKMSLSKKWAENPTCYAYQATVMDVAVHDPGYVLSRNIADVYTVGSTVFMLGHPHYGAMGEVLDPGVNEKTGRVKVAMGITAEPNFESIKKQFADSEAQWMSTSIAAQRLGLSTHFLSRITGTIYVTQDSADPPENGKRNIGLNMKFTKRNEQLPGYTKKSSGLWQYSTKSIGLIRSYMQQYPRLFERLSKNTTADIYTEEELFEPGSEKLSEVVAWLKEQPFSSVGTRSCNGVGLDDDTIAALQREIENVANSNDRDTGRTVLMQVKPYLLFKSGLHSANLPPDSKAQHKLFDRIISVKESSSVPLGYKGTITGIIYGETASDTTYDVLFDKEFVGGVSFVSGGASQRYQLHEAEFINISHGMRTELNVATITSGIPNQARAPQKSWRSDAASARKQQPQAGNSTAQNPRTIFLPPRSQNNKSSNTEQQQQQQSRVTKKNKAPTNRVSEQDCEPQNKIKQVLDPSKSQPLNKRDTENVETKIRIPNVQKPPSRADEKSEFLLLWNELHKAGSTPTNMFSQNPIIPPQLPQPKQVSLPTTGVPLQDESAFLKAMLKISDESSSTSSQSTISSVSKPIVSAPRPDTSSAPPLVQQLFDHARQASREENISYCARLLTHLQLAGRGMPRYNYLTNPQKMVCAQIVLPDMRIYCGEFCSNHGQAAESAAKIVCKELHLETVPKPGLSILGAPPAMWLNSLQNEVPTQQHNARPPPMMTPRSPQIFPNMHNPQMHSSQMLNPRMQNPPMHMPQWNPPVQRAPPFPQPPHSNIDQNRPAPNPVQAVQSTAEVTPSVNKTQNKNKKNTPFVPLQAQKKTRNPKSKQTVRNQNQAAKETKHPPKSSEPTPKDDTPKISTEDKAGSNERNDTDAKKTPQTAQKVQRAPRPRRSRIAANFNSTPTANGSGPQ